MKDEQIVALFWEKDEAAIRNSDAKYGKSLHRISFNILANREDSEECVNDTYVKAWNAIPPERPLRLFAWLGRITRNLSLNRFYENHAKKRGGQAVVLLSELSDCIPAGQTVEEEVEGKLLTEAIVRWLKGRSEEERTLFLGRYWFGESLASLAILAGTDPNRLAGRMFRLRQSLKDALEKEGITI